MDLKTYLERVEVTPYAFARRNGLHYQKVYRVLKGRPPTPALAVQIVKATRGIVTLEDLIPDLYEAKALTLKG